jgi:hypothetical protein
MELGVSTAEGVVVLVRRGLPVWAQPQSGESMDKRSCAACHDGGVERAPRREVLQAMSPERVLTAMETGEMIYMAARWPAARRRERGPAGCGRVGRRPLPSTASRWLAPGAGSKTRQKERAQFIVRDELLFLVAVIPCEAGRELHELRYVS